MKKPSKLSCKLQRDASSRPDWPPPQELTEKEKFIEKRRTKNPNVAICELCGGVIWELGSYRRCGDCFCKY